MTLTVKKIERHGIDGDRKSRTRSPAGFLAKAVIALALIAASFTSVADELGGAVASADGERVRFQGRMVNQNASDGAFPVTTVQITGEITATHIGHGQVNGEATINVQGLVEGNCSELVVGEISFTAADASVLEMVMTTNAACLEPDGSISFTADYKVVGGTGRFDDARGKIRAEGVIDLTTGQSVGSVSGKLKLDDDDSVHDCEKVVSPWFVDEDGVTNLRGDLVGTTENLSEVFTPLDPPIFAFTAEAIVHEEGGDIFTTYEGTLNVATLDAEFTGTFDGGTDDWIGVYGVLLIEGNVAVGGDSSGWLCVPGDDDDEDDD